MSSTALPERTLPDRRKMLEDVRSLERSKKVIAQGVPEFKLKLVSSYSLGAGLFACLVIFWWWRMRLKKRRFQEESLDFSSRASEGLTKSRASQGSRSRSSLQGGWQDSTDNHDDLSSSAKDRPVEALKDLNPEQKALLRERSDQVFSGVSMIQDVEVLKRNKALELQESSSVGDSDDVSSVDKVLFESELSPVVEEHASDGHFSKLSLSGDFLFDEDDHKKNSDDG